MSYQSADYAQALAEFGTPTQLFHSGGWVLTRELPEAAQGVGAPRYDAVGCYPLFACANPTQLGADLEALRASGLVAVTLVTDPLGDLDGERLVEWFRPLARPYKPHYLVDLSQPILEVASAHHRRNVRKFLRRGRVEICRRPLTELDRWVDLYDHLVSRHDITGMAAFSRESFRRQLGLPTATLFRAVTETGDLAGMQIWFSNDRHCWYHLGAYNDLGYRLGGTSAAVTAMALEHFQQRRLTWANLGSGAGVDHDAQDGLSRYKRDWSTDTGWAWLCGAVLDPQAYTRACESTGLSEADPGDVPAFFPAYRAPQVLSNRHRREVVHGHID